MDVAPLRDFVQGLAGQATPSQWIAQLVVVAAAITIAWPVANAVCGRVKVAPRWQFGAGEFRRVAFPFFALAFAWLAKLAMEHFAQPVALVQVTVSLLVAWLIIRLAVYVLGHVLPPGATLRLVVRIIAWVAWIGVAWHITGLLPEVIQALDDIGFSAGKDKGTRISLLTVLQALAAMAVTLTLAMWAARITESRVLAAQSVEMSTRVVVVKIVKTVAIIVAVLIALPMAGIDVTVLSVFGGALGVGLGFGLQKIASNYVSGFIVLLERSLRIGDVITVDNRRGIVQAIESRYTVLKGADGTETIVPNESMITKDVIHHTYTDPKVSLVLTVTIAYGADADQACDLLVEIGRRHARVLKDPEANAKVAGLEDYGVRLELTVWIDDPEKGDGDLRSDIFRDILRTFAAKGIQVARRHAPIATPEMANSPTPSKT